MKAVLFGLFAALLLVACTPGAPTGDVVASTAHFEDGSNLVVFEVFDASPHAQAARITVSGDLVYDSVFIGDREYSLSGERVRDEYLADSGTVVAFLDPGSYEVRAYSCFESSFGWKCGCRTADDCGHWMSRKLVVDE